jgi:hypothetical protein
MHEVAELVTAQALLLSARRSLRRKPLGQLLRPVTAHAESGAPRNAAASEAHIEHMATAIDRVTRFGLFRPTCLVRAIALERVTQQANVGATVRIGVRRRSETLLAHAWVECDGRVIGDDPARTRQFVPLHDFSALTE